ncbi:MAG TPA: alcohol dehydrogenase catalytic domain-containing protein [Solirubrobacteraceae bacterium]|nr:alcohol dehydrogenase catalytic domain-containing protein [Solirubrobacteraceae bacterium]
MTSPNGAWAEVRAPSTTALVWTGGTGLEVHDRAAPQAGAGEAVFNVALAGICGSDLHGYRGHPGPRRPPLVLGHEAVGGVEGRDGRFVLFPLFTCGACRSCLAGAENLCERRELLGLNRDGVFAGALSVPDSSLVEVPSAVPDRLAVLTEPLAVAVAALRQDGVAPGDRVLVIGAGPIGLLAVYAARAAGADVSVAEPLAGRRRFAQQLGASQVLERPEDAEAEAFDLVLDAAGFAATVASAMAAVRRGGQVTVLGLGDETVALPLADAVRRGVRIRGHFAYLRRDFAAALELLRADPVADAWLDVVPLAHGADAFRALVDEPDRVTKVLLAP